MVGKGSLGLSESLAETYLGCPKKYWFSHVRKLPEKTDYQRLMGITVHRFIAKMHSSRQNPLYYQTVDNARKAWFWTWRYTLEKNGPNMLVHSKKDGEDFGVAGWICIDNYWKRNIDEPAPLHVEKRYEMPLFPMVKFAGRLDQIRAMPLEKIADIRPELIVNGRLIEGYDPVAIIDLKTGKESYDPRRFNPDITDLALAAYHFELHENLQITAYCWLYFQVYGRLPVAFYWYHLRSGKAFMTYRNKSDFQTFLEIMKYVANGIKAESYPKHPTPRCRKCDYFQECAALRPDRPLMITEPSDGINLGGEITVWPQTSPVKTRQLRLKFPSANDN